MADQRRQGGLKVAFGNRDFRIYTLGSIPSLIGLWVQRLGVAWLAWELTKSATWLGVIGFADLFPVVVIGPLAGAFADRLDRLLVARVLQIANMAQAVALVTLTASGLITIEWLFVLTLLLGALHAAFQPFRQSIIANMVSRDELPAVIAINSAAWHVSRSIGPAIAGIIIAAWGVVPAFALNVFTYLAFLYALFRINLPPRQPVRRSIAEVPREIIEGMRYAFSHRGIATVLIILFAASFLGRPIMELLAGLADNVFDRGADGLGWLTSAAGVGATLAGVWFAQWGRSSWLTGIFLMTIVVMGIALMAFAATDWFWIALPVLAVVAGATTVGGITSQTIVQSLVTENMRGRVLSIYGMIWLGGPAMGALVAGVLSDMVGMRWPIFGAGALCLVAWLWAQRHGAVIAGALRDSED